MSWHLWDANKTHLKRALLVKVKFFIRFTTGKISVTVLILNLHDSYNFHKACNFKDWMWTARADNMQIPAAGNRWMPAVSASCLFLKDNPYHWVEHINMLSLHQTKKLSLSRYLYRGESSSERMSSGFACQHLPNIFSYIIFRFADWATLSTSAWSSKCVCLHLAWSSSTSSQSNSTDFKTLVMCFSTYRLALSREDWNVREQHIRIREYGLLHPGIPLVLISPFSSALCCREQSEKVFQLSSSPLEANLSKGDNKTVEHFTNTGECLWAKRLFVYKWYHLMHMQYA